MKKKNKILLVLYQSFKLVFQNVKRNKDFNEDVW